MKRFLICVLALFTAASVGCARANNNGGKTEPTATPGVTGHAHEGKYTPGDKTAQKQTPDPGASSGEVGALEPQTYVFTSEGCFKEGGFGVFAAGVSTVLTVTMDNAGTEADWRIFVLDDKFTDALRYLPQAYEPVLTESGTINVVAGQYVYAYCTVNGFTSDEPVEGSTVTFTGFGLPDK